MDNRYYCTYFDSKYLLKAISLFRSLQKNEKRPFKVFAICMDELTLTLLKELKIPSVHPVGISQIEAEDPLLIQAKNNRSPVEYLWTCTPTIIQWLLAKFPQIDLITYLDADLYFFSSPDPVFEEMGNNSVIIHEHRFPEELRYLEKYGKYNVGLVSRRRSSEGLDVLTWWRTKCLEWCYAKDEEGKFADQAYLDEWPNRFRGIKVLEHLGAGLAPWNHTQYDISADAEARPSVDSMPVVFYHFHKFLHLIPEIHVPLACELYKLPFEVIQLLTLPYLSSLLEALIDVRSISSQFSEGFDPQGAIDVKLSFIAHASVVEALRNSNTPYNEVILSPQWTLFASEQVTRKR